MISNLILYNVSAYCGFDESLSCYAHGNCEREWLESMHTQVVMHMQAVLALTSQQTHVTVN